MLERIKYSKKVFEDLAHLGQNPNDLYKYCTFIMNRSDYIRQSFLPEFPQDYDMYSHALSTILFRSFLENFKTNLIKQILEDKEKVDKYIDDKIRRFQEIATVLDE